MTAPWWKERHRVAVGERHPNFLYDARQADAIPPRFPPDDHTPAAVVQRVADHGGICVKTHHEDGFGPESIWPTPTHDMIAQVIDEAHARDLTVTMHANSYEAYRFAAEAGVDVIVHGMWNWDGLSGDRSAPPAEIRAVADRLIAREIAFMPTLRVLGGMRSMFEPAFLADARLRAVLPAELIEWYASEDGQWFPTEMREGDFAGLDDAAIRERMGVGISQGVSVADYLVSNGGLIVFGSDTPSSPTYGNPPGLNGFLEMKRLEEIGVSAPIIFRAATIEVARLFRLDRDYGTIEIGKIANLLLLSADPRDSVDAYDSIEIVVMRGTVLNRDALAATHAPLTVP